MSSLKRNAQDKPKFRSVANVIRAGIMVDRFAAVAPPGEGGEASPYGWTSKNYVCAFIVMELLRITRQIHCKAVEQRATLIHRQYNRDWGTSYSRPIPHFSPVTKS